MYKILETTDGKYKGKIFGDENPIIFDNFIFKYLNIKKYNNFFIFSNSNYVIYAEKI